MLCAASDRDEADAAGFGTASTAYESFAFDASKRTKNPSVADVEAGSDHRQY
jgi:hypothetical protein